MKLKCKYNSCKSDFCYFILVVVVVFLVGRTMYLQYLKPDLQVRSPVIRKIVTVNQAVTVFIEVSKLRPDC
jgi:hypothetical protein